LASIQVSSWPFFQRAAANDSTSNACLTTSRQVGHCDIIQNRNPLYSSMQHGLALNIPDLVRPPLPTTTREAPNILSGCRHTDIWNSIVERHTISCSMIDFIDSRNSQWQATIQG
jgi:hypothetical protein